MVTLNPLKASDVAVDLHIGDRIIHDVLVEKCGWPVVSQTWVSTLGGPQRFRGNSRFSGFRAPIIQVGMKTAVEPQVVVSGAMEA